MTQPTHYLDIDFPVPFFDIETEDPDSPTGFTLAFGHVKEAFLDRATDGSYAMRSGLTGRILTIRAVEILEDGIVRSVGDDGDDVLVRLVLTRPRR